MLTYPQSERLLYRTVLMNPKHARVQAMAAAYAKSQASTPRDDGPTAKQIRNLGLLGHEEDTKKVLGQS
jgi:NADH dehydrogenase (ubiquinone) Fe-S protein 5